MKFLVFLTISLVVPGLLQGCSNSKAAAPAPESPDSDLTIDIDNDGTDGEVESCITCGSGKTNPCKRQVPCIKSININAILSRGCYLNSQCNCCLNNITGKRKGC